MNVVIKREVKDSVGEAFYASYTYRISRQDAEAVGVHASTIAQGVSRTDNGFEFYLKMEEDEAKAILASHGINLIFQ